MNIDLTSQAIKPDAYLDLHKRAQLTKSVAILLLDAFFAESKHQRKINVLLLTQRGDSTTGSKALLDEILKEHPLCLGFRDYEDEALGWKGILVRI